MTINKNGSRLSQVSIVERKSRTTNGTNYKWTWSSNFVAYCCYRIKIDKKRKEEIASKLGTTLERLDNRIQHFNSLNSSTENKKGTPSEEVKLIFKTSAYLSDEECSKKIELILKSNEPVMKDDQITVDDSIKEIDVEIIPTKEISNLKESFLDYWKLQQDYQKKEMSQMIWNDFIMATSMMNIKSRGMKIEKRILTNNKEHLKKSIMNEEGDAWLSNGEGVEIKTSFITPLVGSAVSLTGLRLWEEEVKWYLLLVVDISELKIVPKTYLMWVPKEKLDELDKEGRLTTPGMKKTAARNNKNVAKALTLSDEELESWSKEYKTPNWFKL